MNITAQTSVLYTELILAPQDLSSGAVSNILTIAENRAIMISNKINQPGLPSLETELLRGQYLETQHLIQGLKQAGMSS